MSDVFGNVQLGYLVVETNRLADWRRFGAALQQEAALVVVEPEAGHVGDGARARRRLRHLRSLLGEP